MKNQVVRISITLLDVDPSIWRRVEVPAGMTLEGLHDVIQIVMGWADYHLHHLQFGDVMYGVSAPDDREMNDGSKVKLWTVLEDGERVFQYFYDYGDSWCCVVVLEAVAPAVAGVAYPRLIEGAKRGPQKTSEARGAMASFSRPSQTRNTSVTRNCSNGPAVILTHSNSVSTNSTADSPRLRPARPPAARSPFRPHAEATGGPHRMRTSYIRERCLELEVTMVPNCNV